MTEDKVFTPWPQWVLMPDPIVEHCKCCTDPGPNQGKHLHDRTWDQGTLGSVFSTRNRHILTGAVEGGISSDLNDRRARRWRRQ